MALHDVSAEDIIEKTAVELKKELQQPEWAMYVKTGHGRDRPPMDPDWWFTRAASILRRVALIGPIGTEKLRTHYGNRKNYGYAPEHHARGGGAIIRTILKQLDKAGYTKQVEKGIRKGRVVTPKGQALLYGISDQITSSAAKTKKPDAAQSASN